MNTVLEKGNIIAKIRKGENLEEIINYVKSEIYKNGPNSSVVLEIVSYFKLFQPEFFKKDEQEIIATMGLFFKNPKDFSTFLTAFLQFKRTILSSYKSIALGGKLNGRGGFTVVRRPIIKMLESQFIK